MVKKRDSFADHGAMAEQQRMGFQRPIDLSIFNKKPSSQIIKTNSKSNIPTVKIKGIQLYEENFNSLVC